MHPIYSAGRQGVKVRAIQVMSLVSAPLALWGGYEVFRTYGLHPTEGGVLAPLAQRLAVGGFIALIGVGFLAGMIVYGRCYVMSAAVDRERGRVLLTLAGFLVPVRKEVAEADLLASRHSDGVLFTGKQLVAAPWSSLRVRGRPLPLIVDEQGEFLDQELVYHYLLRLPQAFGRRSTAAR